MSRIASQYCRAFRPLAAALALLTAGVASAAPSIVVSLPPYADLLRRVAGPDAEITVLLPAGASPHDFDPSPRALARVAEADLIVLNGGLDAWAEDLVDAAGTAAPTVEALAVLDGLGLLGEAEDAEGEHADEGAHEREPADEHEDERPGADGHGHDDFGVDAHVWLDPVLMAALAPALGEALAEADPAGAADYRANAAALAAELEALDDELRATLAPLRGAAFVPFHGAWSRFAARYGLDLVVEIEPFPGREPTPRYLAEALEAIRASGARAVFSEAQLPERPARVVAAEAGVALGVLDPLGGVPGRSGYAELLRYNASTLVETLGD